MKLDLERRHLPMVTEYPDRDDCRGAPRPCPLVGCSWNLYLDRTRQGAAKLAFPNLEPWEMPKTRSCSLDIAEKGPATVKTVAKALNLTEERIRQIQVEALKKVGLSKLGREVARHRRTG